MEFGPAALLVEASSTMSGKTVIALGGLDLSCAGTVARPG
jgi:hypothetical protein